MHECELYAGEPHDSNPPEAVGRFRMVYSSSEGGNERFKWLCKSCADDKRREFKELGEIFEKVDAS